MIFVELWHCCLHGKKKNEDVAFFLISCFGLWNKFLLSVGAGCSGMTSEQKNWIYCQVNGTVAALDKICWQSSHQYTKECNAIDCAQTHNKQRAENMMHDATADKLVERNMICQSRKRTSSRTPQNIGICIFAVSDAEEVASAGYFQPSYKRTSPNKNMHFILSRVLFISKQPLNNKFENLDPWVQFSGDFTYRTNILFKLMPPCGVSLRCCLWVLDKGSD